MDNRWITFPRYSSTYPAAAGADPGDHRQDDVLAGDAGGQGPVAAVHDDRHGLERAQRQGLGGQHVLHLGGADTEGQRTECTMGGGVRITADHRHTRLGQAQLRPHDVHDALLHVTHRVQPHTELRTVSAQRVDLSPGHLISDRQLDVGGGHVVILSRDRQIGSADRPAGQSQAVEGLRAGDFVHQVQVDIQQIRRRVGRVFTAAAATWMNYVSVPDLRGKCASHERFPPCGSHMLDISHGGKLVSRCGTA